MSGLHNPKATLLGDTRKIKGYFHVLNEDGRRTYGGAGRNSHREAAYGPNNEWRYYGPNSLVSIKIFIEPDF